MKLTNKEASEWLIAIKRDYIHGGDEDYDERRKLALNMGAEALENQKTGHWIFKHDNMLIPTGYYQCSECDEGKLLDKSNFCPECGAKMEGETE